MSISRGSTLAAARARRLARSAPGGGGAAGCGPGQTRSSAAIAAPGSTTCSGRALPKPRNALTGLYDHCCQAPAAGLLCPSKTPRVGGFGGGIRRLGACGVGGGAAGTVRGGGGTSRPSSEPGQGGPVAWAERQQRAAAVVVL